MDIDEETDDEHDLFNANTEPPDVTISLDLSTATQTPSPSVGLGKRSREKNDNDWTSSPDTDASATEKKKRKRARECMAQLSRVQLSSHRPRLQGSRKISEPIPLEGPPGLSPCRI
jgi:hypothetical protein